MTIFTQEEIEALIACPKEISEAPARQMRVDGANMRNDAKLLAMDGRKGVFSLFIRQNLDFQENFSVGLSYSPQDGIRPEIRLIRCNGRHGEFNRGNNAFDPEHPHWHFHVHRASQEALDSGGAAEKNATICPEFASLEEALEYLLKIINVNQRDVERYFQVHKQGQLEFGGD